MNDNSFRKPNYPPKGIYPGCHLNVSYKIDPQETEQFNQIIPPDEIDSHMHVTASTRKGKSEFLKIMFMHRVSKKEGSVVLFDVHGDLSLQCIKMMNRLSLDVEDFIFVDLFLKKGYTPTINPFRIGKVKEETVSIVAQELMSAFESIISTDFTDNMEVFLTPLIYILLMKGDSGIDELIKYLDNENYEELLAFALTIQSKYHRDFIKNEFNKPKFTKTKEALSTKLRIFLCNPVFSRFVTGESTINLRKALNSGKNLIFRFPKGKMRKVLAPAIKLIMALIQGIVFQKADSPKDLRPKTYLICDEFQNFFSQISDEILSESGKNNLFITMAHQYLTQLDTTSRDGVLSGANIFVVGKNSDKELNAMAKQIEVDVSLLKNLKRGEFYIKVGSNNAIKILTTNKYIDDKYSMSEIEWKKVKKYQRKRYYKKIDETIEDISIVSIPDKTPSLPIPKFDEN
ncbi:MAG: DUF87 domain-containing protein [Aliarcobacter sp.]|nr:DUF87 domain-containing protein [Aliarcobacter sp.]